MKSYIEKFKELTYEELLDVNGGYGTKTSTSSTTRRRAITTTTTKKTYDPLTSGLENLSTKSKSNIPVGYDPKTGWLPGYGPNSNAYQVSTSGDKTKETNTVNQESSNVKQENKTDFNNGLSSLKNNRQEQTYENINNENNDTSMKDYIVTKGDPDQKTDFAIIVESTIVVHSEDKYVISDNPNKEWRCDNFAKAVVEQSGGDYTKNFAGDPTVNSVQNHIDYGKEKYNLKDNKKSAAPDLNDGVYVVFMNDSYVISSKTGKPLDPHCGIVIVRNGVYSYSDNSSNNNGMLGGVSTVEYSSLQNFQNDYGYNKFYYSPVTEIK